MRETNDKKIIRLPRHREVPVALVMAMVAVVEKKHRPRDQKFFTNPAKSFTEQWQSSGELRARWAISADASIARWAWLYLRLSIFIIVSGCTVYSSLETTINTSRIQLKALELIYLQLRSRLFHFSLFFLSPLYWVYFSVRTKVSLYWPCKFTLTLEKKYVQIL